MSGVIPISQTTKRKVSRDMKLVAVTRRMRNRNLGLCLSVCLSVSKVSLAVREGRKDVVSGSSLSLLRLP